jgi:hypothetical protein
MRPAPRELGERVFEASEFAGSRVDQQGIDDSLGLAVPAEIRPDPDGGHKLVASTRFGSDQGLALARVAEECTNFGDEARKRSDADCHVGPESLDEFFLVDQASATLN